MRFLESAEAGQSDADGACAILRELKAVGGDLRALRIALDGRDRAPELWAAPVALGRDESVHLEHRAGQRLRLLDGASTTRSRPLQGRAAAAARAICMHFVVRLGLRARTRRERAAVHPRQCGSVLLAPRDPGYDVKVVDNITDINDKIYEAAPG